ncbi:SAM hydrolase/SAM-dependent halogenase family protein [Dermabacter vaginalis]|uniref:SAM hydrolase/SAM-dependent halogenase family protein n=1 Tax=Dermabacter vaginalis TaxID=1630135 RepID=UPI001EF43296|nr:S-adenosyl-l-methionine hydroxide adenosyltransferase family protein [Dermabacter vaginalis]
MGGPAVKPLVLQSDFGYVDGAVSAMYGVATGVHPELRIHDVTHNIPPYDIWEGSYRLAQVVSYWPEGTVFVSVVDPGVGSDRLSVVARTSTGHYVVTPNNGTLTHIEKLFGIEELREIDEHFNRREGSAHSYTFHGRDIYAFTGARLASGTITYEQVGPSREVSELVTLPVLAPKIEGNALTGTIDAHDNRYGSLWTSIPRAFFEEAGICHGDYVRLTITHNGQTVHATSLVYAPSFAHVEVGESLIYVNSLDRVAVAINRGSYANAFHLGRGNSWHVAFEKVEK